MIGYFFLKKHPLYLVDFSNRIPQTKNPLPPKWERGWIRHIKVMVWVLMVMELFIAFPY